MLSQVRQRTLIASLNGQGRKVFDAVPAAEAWSITHIQAELTRVGGNGRDVRLVQGCLAQLIGIGLVFQPKAGLFLRAPVREASTTNIEEAEDMPEFKTPPPPPAVPRTPVDILSPIVARLRTLADDIETAALEVEESFANSKADGAKLRQLQVLLKGLTE